METAELLGSSSIPLGFDDDVNFEETAAHRDMADPVTLVLPSEAGQQSRDVNEATETDTSSGNKPQATAQSTVDTLERPMQLFRSLEGEKR